MAGGPSCPALVIAAARAGALGFLAAGYKSPEAMLAEIAAVRAGTGASFGVNLFLPGAPYGSPVELARYVTSVGADPGNATWDDDHYEGKVAALLADPPPVVSFTFGCPAAEVIAAFRDAGTVVGVTVTSPAEALIAAAAGAGAVCEVPVIAAGGIMTAAQVRAALAAGAAAVQCGTAFLRCAESGAHPLHKAALIDPAYTETVLTRAFSGRPARGLLNQFIRDHPGAPAAYPEINNATRPLRAAAAASGDTDRMSLWAGQGFRSALDGSAGEIVARLSDR